jgi:hypothetical protein
VPSARAGQPQYCLAADVFNDSRLTERRSHPFGQDATDNILSMNYSFAYRVLRNI